MQHLSPTRGSAPLFRVALVATLSVAMLTGCAARLDDSVGEDEDKFAQVAAVPVGGVLFGVLLVAGVITWSQTRTAYETQSSYTWIQALADIATAIVQNAWYSGDDRSPDDIVSDAAPEDWEDVNADAARNETEEEISNRLAAHLNEVAISRFEFSEQETGSCYVARVHNEVLALNVPVVFTAYSPNEHIAISRAAFMCARAADLVPLVHPETCYHPPEVSQEPAAASDGCETKTLQLTLGTYTLTL